MVNLELVLAALVAVLLVVAAIVDGRHRIIPNRLNLAIALLAIPYWWATSLALWPDVAIQFGIAAIAFAILLGVFWLGQMGGGDVKLIVALALFLAPLDFLRMIFIMAIAGGILTLVMVVRYRMKGSEGPFENPYGIAIAIGGLVALSERYLNHLP
ncbi:MAG: prepilin peptidase [Sphingomonadales bacterium]